MLLNERIIEKAEISKEPLHPGVLKKVWYPIIRFDVRNKNNRQYGRDVAEAILKDPEIQSKLKTRTLFGNKEHPELSQIKLDCKENSHINS